MGEEFTKPDKYNYNNKAKAILICDDCNDGQVVSAPEYLAADGEWPG